MSVIGSNVLAGSSGQGGDYNLTNSLRFRKSASAYLNRTPASAGNQKTFTFSTWLKRGGISSDHSFFTSGNAAPNPRASFEFTTSDTLYISFNNGSGWVALTTSAVYRDPSAWYHIVVAVDTTQATSTNRVKLYVNGSQVTAFSSATYPNQNDNTSFNDTVPHSIGSYIPSPSQYLDGYMDEINFIDGQALTPSSFGQTSTTTGVWIPKKFSGTYGTNGFYLPFTDVATTSSSNVGLGKDFSGNGNYWTTNNISVTAGATYDSMFDVPTLTSATTANYCVLNPLDKGGTVNPKNGNLGFANTAGTYNIVRSTVGITSGKWYFEYTIVNSASIGGGSTSAGLVRYDSVLAGKYLGQDTNTLGSVSSGTPSLLLYNGTNKALSSGLNSFSVGAVIQYAYDADAGKLWVGVNNSWDGGNDPSTGSTPTLSSGFAGSSGPWFFAANGLTSPDDVAVNFGQRPFSYTPPTGFVALNTFNLATPTIGATASTQANRYMDVLTWTGNGASSRAITGLNFQPDFVWDKMRSDAYQHAIVDAVRGGNRVSHSNSTSTEDVNWQYGYVSSFNSDGFTIQAGSTSSENWNLNAATFVAWNWKGANGSVTNTQGSITSTVSANTTSGFSVVTYTGNGTSGATVGHGLGVAPSMYIVKTRSTTESWITYHISIGATNYLALNLTQASSAATAAWNNTAPTSTVFSLGNAGSTNGSGNTFVAYCFAQVAGYSAFGSYTGNGSTDGPFIFTGFRPRFVMFKSTGIENWIIHDTARDPYNVSGSTLIPNLSDSEYSNNQNMDILSNGVKMRSTNDATNTNGVTYTYMAFAENPFKYANAR